ncbi:hypothetical protein KP77_32760 [Jeotgalibacillus alimentarius]|uniref:Uncharacterized protein n=1 Tax=Jeotgalibacillus alimentarius TaxID=135826 RepID=A0A0C2QZU4_9BACL|nr:hypothetical protein KP77_32760 [Jeotgalibacillus alimentarius]
MPVYFPDDVRFMDIIGMSLRVFRRSKVRSIFRFAMLKKAKKY